MNAATAAKHFELTARSIPSCGRDICFHCCAGTCPDAVDPDGGFELEPLSDDALVAICDSLEFSTLTLSEAA